VADSVEVLIEAEFNRPRWTPPADPECQAADGEH
jgi:hypothetical protein